MNELKERMEECLKNDNVLINHMMDAVKNNVEIANFMYDNHDTKEYGVVLTRSQIMINSVNGQFTFIDPSGAFTSLDHFMTLMSSKKSIVNGYSMENSYDAVRHAMANTYALKSKILCWPGYYISNPISLVTEENSIEPAFVFAYFPDSGEYLAITKTGGKQNERI